MQTSIAAEEAGTLFSNVQSEMNEAVSTFRSIGETIYTANSLIASSEGLGTQVDDYIKGVESV